MFVKVLGYCLGLESDTCVLQRSLWHLELSIHCFAGDFVKAPTFVSSSFWHEIVCRLQSLASFWLEVGG